MKGDAKQDWKRIGIYLLICFSITYLAGIPCLWGRTFEEFAEDTRLTLISSNLMLFPAIAVILTRLLTKEGLENSYLRLRLKGNLVPYLLAVLLPLGSGAASVLIRAAVTGGFTLAGSPAWVTGMILIQLATAFTTMMMGFGEELGWRGYLYPKLERRLGTVPALLIGGVIWGVWHAPLTVAGHDFGRDYWGYPVTGILMMCVFCVIVGIPMYYVTKKTHSVYPAALFHSILNSTTTVMISLFHSDVAGLNQVAFMILLVLPLVVIAVICLWLMLRRKPQTAV